MRQISFTLFFLSSFLSGIALAPVGILSFRSGQVHRAIALLLIVYPGVNVALFVRGESLFLAPALAVILLGGVVLGTPMADPRAVPPNGNKRRS